MHFCHDICQESKSTDHVDCFLSGTGELKTIFFVLTPPNIYTNMIGVQSHTLDESAKPSLCGTLRVPQEHGASWRYLFSCVLTYFQHGASMVMTEIPCKTSAMWLEQ